MARIELSASRKLNGRTLIALRVLTQKLGEKPKTVYSWARRNGVRGHRLPTIRLCGSRYTTIQAFNKFIADVNGWTWPLELGDRLVFCVGVLAGDDDDDSILDDPPPGPDEAQGNCEAVVVG